MYNVKISCVLLGAEDFLGMIMKGTVYTSSIQTFCSVADLWPLFPWFRGAMRLADSWRLWLWALSYGPDTVLEDRDAEMNKTQCLLSWGLW